MVSKTHDVLQQTRLVDLRACVTDTHTAPIGLACYQAIAFEQLAGEGFCHRRFIQLRCQQLWRGLVVRAFQIQTVKVETVEFMHRLFVEILRQDQLHTNTRHDRSALPNRGAQVFTKTCLHRRSIRKHRVVKTVEVELDRFALDDMR